MQRLQLTMKRNPLSNRSIDGGTKLGQQRSLTGILRIRIRKIHTMTILLMNNSLNQIRQTPRRATTRISRHKEKTKRTLGESTERIHRSSGQKRNQIIRSFNYTHIILRRDRNPFTLSHSLQHLPYIHNRREKLLYRNTEFLLDSLLD